MSVLFAAILLLAAGPADRSSPEAKAVAFLCREVPRWSRQNHCYSCHNNGDAAIALYQAAPAGFGVASEVLADTTRWLKQPGNWEHNGGEGPFSDKRLAQVVFSGAVSTAVSTGAIKDRSFLLEAARRLAADQAVDGSWPLEGEESVGSPATYGQPLATLVARQTLFAADRERYRAAIDRADRWLLRREIQNIDDAAVVLLALHQVPAGENHPRRKLALDLLRRGQTDDGGWGPRLATPPEPFDTALALLALSRCGDSEEVKTMVRRGRAFLVAQQREDGSWIETTRPAGNVSYAQRISTAGWATQALLATRTVGLRPR
jgi:Squalene-hopene cyclase C-terminal domain